MVQRKLNTPVDAASLAALRIAVGAVLLVLTVRFAAHGWISREFQRPGWFFPYWGFEWIRPLPGRGMEALYLLMAGAAALITLGVAYRAAAAFFAVAFTYAHLCDVTNYLNHYYLVSLLTACMAVAPLDRLWSVRAWLRPNERRDQARTWMLWLFRLQVGVVYVFGGLGKLGSDWLLRGEPLHIWLSTRQDLPLLGSWLGSRWAAVGLSWCGLVFDLSVVPLLLWRRTQSFAYVAAVFFHVSTSVLFSVGMFPWIMLAAAPVLCAPSWPRRLLRSAPRTDAVAGAPVGATGAAALATYAAVQLAVPLRHFIYPANTLWTEEGFRFAWRVMLIEKQGALELTVVEPDGHRTQVSPREYLTPFQTAMASTQPDLILALAHHVADDWAAHGRGPVRVYADAQVSFNGRPHQAMIDPTVDLAAAHDSFAPKPWILPAPGTEPRF